MNEHLTTEVRRYPEQANRCAAKQRCPSMVWYLDPMTGRPTARWVVEQTNATADEQLSAAA